MSLVAGIIILGYIPLLGYGKHFDNPKVNWMYHSEPEQATGGRKIFQPRGKVVGGSSSINGLVYIRAKSKILICGILKESMDGIITLFYRILKSEKNMDIQDQYHGSDGELSVSSPKDLHPLATSFVKRVLIWDIP
ncbi:MAG: hypothetical protein CM15mP111_4420 [Hyphomicrobiales bacterium]|nr:MAG: hypothetical protein CM15mP111_4420 [Hyphomicrobiales bacterium]